ncbi:MAG: FHA domain-containing protein [Chloroflexi bacterium]|nr:FHA domain-containing protein [Chloroflexota bacterium]
MPWYLQFEHDVVPEPWPLPGDEVRVGRSRDNDLVLPVAEVSRHHARLFPQEEGWAIEDLGSTNGTWVNSERLRPHEPHPLRPGDRVRFSPYVTARVITDADVAAPPTRVIPARQAEGVPGTEPLSESAPPRPETTPGPHVGDKSAAPEPAGVTYAQDEVSSAPPAQANTAAPVTWQPASPPPRASAWPHTARPAPFWQRHPKLTAGLAMLAGFVLVFGLFLWWVDVNYLWCDFFAWVPIFVCP